MTPRAGILPRSRIPAVTGDSGFDILILSGPLVILLVGLWGRNSLTSVLAVLYLTSFVVYVLANGVRRD